ncbi:Leucine Rich repeat-containing protein [Singulisphaera sp. GP187]|uniref:leucine-rich repeat domain-containing protein n=1 Tax=Singulisphaera sp. GP187 TaxID=1882752 RepID=UPI00092AA183|nr:hypothetical protein [Singulisphaera sp. GP187]SIO57578.1 Leucine Rich repeat-containing protein [Singulisphaera sp. GP187]
MHRSIRLAAAWSVLAAGVGGSIPTLHLQAAPPEAPVQKKGAVTPVASAAVGPRSAVAFGFGGKVGPKDQGFVPGFESYKLRFGPGDWAGARIIITSAWGDKNPDTDLWNWPDGRNVRATDALSDKDGSYFIYSLATANADDWVVANFRYTLRDGRHGVASTIIPYGGNPEIPKQTVAALGFGGRLGPKDEGYLPDFESYKLRFGPGDWAGTKVLVSSNWGEGSDDADLWGWKDGTEARSSEVRRDAQGYYFVHSLRAAGHSRWVASLFRFARKDGRSGVAQSLYSFSGALVPPKPPGQSIHAPTAPPPAARKLPKPTSRVLAAARPTVADLKYLRELTDAFQGMELDEFAETTRLDLNGKAIDDEGMVHLRGLKRLRTLSLRGTRVGDAGLENLAGLTSLRELNLIGTPTTDVGLQVVSRLTGLTDLNVDQTLVTDSGMIVLRKLANLEELTLVATDVGDTGLAALKGLARLRRLVLGKDPAFVGERITGAGLAALQTLPNLEQLGLSFLTIGDDGLAQLRGMRKLSLLDVSSSNVTDAGLVHLKTLPELKQLHLDATPVTAAGLAHLKEIPKLKYLFLGYSDLGDAAMAQLAPLKNLEVLAVTKGNVTDAGLAQLRGLTQLDRLFLPDNKITGAGVANLQRLTRLNQLNLYYNKLDDASLAVFKALPELRQLYISGDQITDAGLVHLKALKNLRYLNISWTKVTQAGLDDLKKSLPELRVDSGDF